jgi:hypothetical protein
MIERLVPRKPFLPKPFPDGQPGMPWSACERTLSRFIGKSEQDRIV